MKGLWENIFTNFYGTTVKPETRGKTNFQLNFINRVFIIEIKTYST